jgi:serine/threonine protein phosphatase PrpC
MSETRGIRLEAAFFSKQGGRDYNEDHLGECESLGGLRLFVLADGAGGQGGGEIAARTAVAAVQAALRELPVFSPETVRRCIEDADAAVAARQQFEPGATRMASTVVLLLVSCQRSKAVIGNLGDSRCYVFRGNSVIAQTHDHSVVQRSIDAGLYPANKLRQHPQRSVLYASLGAHTGESEPYVSDPAVVLEPGDGLLLCSDGVWELLEDSELAELHASSNTVELWRDRLASAVEARMPATHDNYSAFVLRCLPAISTDDDTLPPGVAAAMWAQS